MTTFDKDTLEANARLLSNFEVKDLLLRRGADKGPLGGSITVAECKVYDYLVETPAGTQTRASIEEFVTEVKSFNLTEAEKLQSINMRPATAVEVHLIVEDCDERLSSGQVDRFTETVTEILPEPPVRPADDEEEKNGEESEERGMEEANPDAKDQTEGILEE